jgi:hypothetical protein
MTRSRRRLRAYIVVLDNALPTSSLWQSRRRQAILQLALVRTTSLESQVRREADRGATRRKAASVQPPLPSKDEGPKLEKRVGLSVQEKERESSERRLGEVLSTLG